MNFRTFLKNTIKEAQKFYPNASVENSVSDWFARNEFVRMRLKRFGVIGDFFSVMELLRARDENGQALKGRSIYRIGKAALKQGKMADLRKMRDFFVTGMGVHNMKFEGRAPVPVFDVNKAIKFNTLNKIN